MCFKTRLFATVSVLLGLLITGTTSRGRAGGRAATLPLSDKSDAFVHRVFAITQVVLDHNIDPPTRQEMILGGMKAALAAMRSSPFPDLSRRVSDVRTEEELQALLAALPDDVQPHLPLDPGPGTKDRTAQFEKAFIDGLLNRVPGRPNLVSAKEARAKSQFQANRYVGLGIAVSEDEKKRICINVLVPGGSAEAGGVRPGDRIEAIDDVAVAPGTRVQDVVEQLRGDEGTKVTLRLHRDDSHLSRTLTLARLPVVSRSVQLPDKSLAPIAYLKIDSISASTAQELRSLESKLQEAGTRGVILDLRGTWGSGVDTDHSAVLFADSLLDGVRLGSLRTRDRVQEFTADRDCLFRDCALVVLINEYTGGAGEWVAAALQDANPPTQQSGRRAIILGKPSRGNNLVEQTIPVPGSEEFLVLATAVWSRPNPDRQRKELVAQSIAGLNPNERAWHVVPDADIDEMVVSTNGAKLAFTEFWSDAVETFIGRHFKVVTKKSSPQQQVVIDPAEKRDEAVIAARDFLQRNLQGAAAARK
jgi:C-terminal peptidase prc